MNSHWHNANGLSASLYIVALLMLKRNAHAKLELEEHELNCTSCNIELISMPFTMIRLPVKLSSDIIGVKVCMQAA